MYKLKLQKEIEYDLSLLDEKLTTEVLNLIDKFKTDYFKYSLLLYGNLGSRRKTYFGNAEYRIISKLENNTIKIINIIAIGKRKELEIYKIADSRINKTKPH